MMNQTNVTANQHRQEADMLAGSQQPISLMTINANPNRKEDLLIIRVLEASERKMQLIKRLLSPEEFNSIQFDQYPNGLNTRRIDKQQQQQQQLASSEDQASNSVPTDFVERQNVFEDRRAKSWSGSDFRVPRTSNDLHSNLAKKREALEFFFREQTTNFSDKQDNLAIELRSGYYLGSTHQIEADKLIKCQPSSLRDRIVDFLGFLGISYSPSVETTTMEEDQFDNLHRVNSVGEPYTRKRNIVAMRKRLQAADGELNKVLKQDNDSQWGSKQGSRFSNLVDLAKMHKNHMVISSRPPTDHNQVKVVEPVGHFNTIHLFGPQKFCPSIQVELVLQEPSPPRLLRYLGAYNGRQDLSKSDTDLLSACSGAIKLKLSTLLVTNHKLMLAEERAALRVVELMSRERLLGSQKDQLSGELARFIESYEIQDSRAAVAPEAKLERLRKIFETLTDVMRQIVLTQQEILIVFRELESLRAEQEFTSTSIMIESRSNSSSSSLDTLRGLLSKLINSIQMKCKDESQQEFVKLCGQFLEEYINYGNKEQIMSINSNGAKLTLSNECPVNEAERRRQIQYWLASIRLRLLIGDKYFYDCHLDNNNNEYSSLLYRIDLKENQLTVPTFGGDESLELKVQLLRPKYRLMPRIMHLEASATIHLPKNNLTNRSHCILFKFVDETSSAQLKLESGPEPYKRNRNLSRGTGRCKSDELLDLLYRKIFNLTNQNWLDNSEIKFARLINKCDTSILVRLLGYKVHSRPRFELDPFIDYLDDRTAAAAAADHERSQCKNVKKWANTSTRQALIVWRWLNNLQQLVYLSERENAKNYSLPLEEFKSKLEAIVVNKKQETGFRSIEQLRALAADYIREYEAQLKEMLKYRGEEERDFSQQANKLKDMLREPKLKVDLSGLVRVARSLKPKRTAKRPLLPRRQVAGRLHRGPLKVIGGGAAALPTSHSEPLAGSSVDIEAQQELGANWQRLLTSHGASRLQVVVTVQQATNVPMRVVTQARPMSQSTNRPNSPFVSQIGSPATSFMAQLMQPAATPIQYLEPPTTYVEIVFQRRQQASSLAQGKSPAWNETLFFPVDVAAPAPITSDTLGQRGTRNSDQLVDEFLQLNLYDYNCFLQDDLESTRSDAHELSTLPLVSNDPNSMDLNSAAMGGADNHLSVLGGQRIQAARQRIERHLLGSMRVPLTTLMSSGRIEGSFALKQPLLLENYEFEPNEMSLGHNMLGQPATLLAGGANSPLLTTQDWPNRRSTETHISLFITLDPPVSMPIHLLHLPTGSHESEQVLELARLWELVVVHHRYRATLGQQTGSRPFARSRHAHRHRQSRHIRALVLQRDAKYCLISRLLVALEPPAELLTSVEQSKLDKGDAMQTLARFVSLLSPLKYGLFGMRLLASSLWFDSSQLIDKSLGGPEEKAVLLCNYFLYLGISSALLLGDAVPEGRCVYVIVWHEPQSRFIEDQLQLQAASLLESISSLAGAPNPNRMAELYNQRPIERSDFVSRLPILMKANSLELFDPGSGKCYSLSDHPPLISVGSIVTMENIYANIQSVENPAETNYDIRSKHLWFPLFDSSSSAGAGGINSMSSTLARSLGGKQNPQLNWRRQLLQLDAMRKSVGHPHIGPILSPETKLNYHKFSTEECDELKEAIEKVIKSHLLRWRPDRPTYFNRTLSRLLADKLALFEGYSSTMAGDQKPEWRSELANLIKNEVTMAHLSSSGLNTRQVISCPINLPYTSMKTIVDSIFASGVHNADLMLESSQIQSNSSSQFLVACHVNAYPARVMSVWLYVAAILPITRGVSRPLMA